MGGEPAYRPAGVMGAGRSPAGRAAGAGVLPDLEGAPGRGVFGAAQLGCAAGGRLTRPAGAIGGGKRHRRTARLWPAWLRNAWPQAEVWVGWSEVTLGRLRPDAQAWGALSGREALFWLEVESGKASRQELRGKTNHRFEQALLYTRRFSLSLVFALLAPAWVLRAVVAGFVGLPGDAAVVLADWKAFGELPVPGWGVARAE